MSHKIIDQKSFSIQIKFKNCKRMNIFVCSKNSENPWTETDIPLSISKFSSRDLTLRYR